MNLIDRFQLAFYYIGSLVKLLAGIIVVLLGCHYALEQVRI